MALRKGSQGRKSHLGDTSLCSRVHTEVSCRKGIGTFRDRSGGRSTLTERSLDSCRVSGQGSGRTSFHTSGRNLRSPGGTFQYTGLGYPGRRPLGDTAPRSRVCTSASEQGFLRCSSWGSSRSSATESISRDICDHDGIPPRRRRRTHRREFCWDWPFCRRHSVIRGSRIDDLLEAGNVGLDVAAGKLDADGDGAVVLLVVPVRHVAPPVRKTGIEKDPTPFADYRLQMWPHGNCRPQGSWQPPSPTRRSKSLQCEIFVTFCGWFWHLNWNRRTIDPINDEPVRIPSARFRRSPRFSSAAKRLSTSCSCCRLPVTGSFRECTSLPSLSRASR